jgi:DNA polymerase-3 subunit epsilon
VLVAHNARFDYGFLKHEFARLGRSFSAPVLCTVKLSRRLYPDHGGHSLDALIARHGLSGGDRHRALGDARALLQFVRTVYRERAGEEIAAATRRILRTPSLPPQLPADAISSLPEAPGVYLFYGLNALPLYIGKSRNLRERVGAHFSSDYRSESDHRMSNEIVRIEHERTAGELGALLREAQLVRTLMPAHNHRLRRCNDRVVLALDGDEAIPRYLRASAMDTAAVEGLYGPFASRAGARSMLRMLAAEHALCWTALGLERRHGPCFARQLRRCAGACVGAETRAAHDGRLRAALAAHAVKPWPYTGPIAVREADPVGDRVDVHVFDQWRWIGTAQDDFGLSSLLESSPREPFDADVYRLLLRALPRSQRIDLGSRLTQQLR